MLNSKLKTCSEVIIYIETTTLAMRNQKKWMISNEAILNSRSKITSFNCIFCISGFWRKKGCSLQKEASLLLQ